MSEEIGGAFERLQTPSTTCKYGVTDRWLLSGLKNGRRHYA